MAQFIEPGSVVGIIGGGVLGYRLALAARRLGMHTVVLAGQGDVALQAADMSLAGEINNEENLKRLASLATVITYADETIDGTLLSRVARPEQLPSGTDILAVTQDRYLEKVYLDDLNMNILPYAQVVTPNDIAKAVETVGFPALLKPIQKGVGVDQQLRLTQPQDVERAAQLLQQRPYIVEAWLDQPEEFSVLVAKVDDQVTVLPVVQNFFDHHQLTASLVPPACDDAVQQEIQRVAGVLAKKMAYNGVFGVELFLTKNRTLYVKRLYPGPQLFGDVLEHTTGYSPYELHLRALLGWPLPTPVVTRPGALLPLRLGDRTAAMTQVQIKPDWQFHFFPEGASLIGEIAVFGELAELNSSINATEHFHIGTGN
ncbi:ATP-grasp domain-containing protein [Lacticaseibacillus yichunensis]|uniref:ATP-grasp domain-containing protein n=1 Tax=Lacticaseibacillus yichunensis TaxID=2486015 RepID=A0ABW4CNQ2_9LACO|nr:ATP-grasp domain-containing protein [Lacticaseibacillus yichunensis]